MLSAEKLSESPNDVYNCLFYITNPGKLDEKIKSDGTKIVLWTMEYVDWMKRKGLIKAWGEKGKQLFDFFHRGFNERNYRLYSFRSATDIPESDNQTLYLKAFEPNPYESGTYCFVYSLTTKSRSFHSKKLMTEKTFPTPAIWKDKQLQLENGDFLPHPETWLDEKPVNLENLLDAKEIDIVSPFKKQKTHN